MTGSANESLRARPRDERSVGRVRAHRQSESRRHAELADVRAEQLADDDVRRERCASSTIRTRKSGLALAAAAREAAVLTCGVERMRCIGVDGRDRIGGGCAVARAEPSNRRYRRGPIRLAGADRRDAAARFQDGRGALQLLARARERRHEAHDEHDSRLGRALGQRQQHDAGDLPRERHARECVAARRHQDQGRRADVRRTSSTSASVAPRSTKYGEQRYDRLTNCEYPGVPRWLWEPYIKEFVNMPHSVVADERHDERDAPRLYRQGARQHREQALARSATASASGTATSSRSGPSG